MIVGCMVKSDIVNNHQESKYEQYDVDERVYKRTSDAFFIHSLPFNCFNWQNIVIIVDWLARYNDINCQLDWLVFVVNGSKDYSQVTWG